MSIDRGSFLAALLAMGALGVGCGDDAEAASEEPATHEEGTSGSEADAPPAGEGETPAAEQPAGETPAEEPAGEEPAPAPTGE